MSLQAPIAVESLKRPEKSEGEGNKDVLSMPSSDSPTIPIWRKSTDTTDFVLLAELIGGRNTGTISD